MTAASLDALLTVLWLIVVDAEAVVNCICICCLLLSPLYARLLLVPLTHTTVGLTLTIMLVLLLVITAVVYCNCCLGVINVDLLWE